ncbi:hypothetical protein [Paraburkholderia atlantica]|uniref:hypothetical protein n=1 Tax=Paraburkholderia atlantica TaxID=2654982 RepID=UPI001621AA80|nr:hypothetical protein [Paraburkholderia atlantica]MBB5508137.1 hypothetical protein [Paraburkholderia atlantica]
MIDLDKLEADIEYSSKCGDSAALPIDVAFELIAEVRALREDAERMRAQAYELMGVVADVEEGNGFDSVCLRTIKRVIGELAEKPRARDCSKCGEKGIPAGKYCKSMGCPLNPATKEKA